MEVSRNTIRIKEAKVWAGRLWRQRRSDNPTDTDMFTFFAWLQKKYPNIVAPAAWRGRDPWQTIHCWLIQEEQKITKEKKKKING